ncbi:topoisomerase DNA-binding C4 zinc finger domain-containing protein [Paenibacillus sp. YSY-4.3]
MKRKRHFPSGWWIHSFNNSAKGHFYGCSNFPKCRYMKAYLPISCCES